MKDSKPLFTVSSILWLIWGLVHIFAGILTMQRILTDDVSGAVPASPM